MVETKKNVKPAKVAVKSKVVAKPVAKVVAKPAAKAAAKPSAKVAAKPKAVDKKMKKFSSCGCC